MPSSPTPTSISCCQPKSFFPSFQLQHHLDQSNSHGPKGGATSWPPPSSVQFNSAQPLSHVWLLATPWTAAHQASLSITNSQSLPKPLSIESVMPSNHLILCCPLFLLPSIFYSIRVFSNESALHIRWPKYWSFSFSISPSNEHPVLISFRMDWLGLLTVQGNLKSLLQHHSSKASILHSAFFIVQLLHLYMTTGKTIALTRRTFVGKVTSSHLGLYKSFQWLFSIFLICHPYKEILCMMLWR